MHVRRIFAALGISTVAWLLPLAPAAAQFTQPQLRELIRDGIRDGSIPHGDPTIDYAGRNVEINLGWVQLNEPDPLWYFPYTDQCLVELIRAKYEKNPGEALAWQPYLKQAEALIAKEIAALEAYEKAKAARPAPAQGVGQILAEPPKASGAAVGPAANGQASVYRFGSKSPSAPSPAAPAPSGPNAVPSARQAAPARPAGSVSNTSARPRPSNQELAALPLGTATNKPLLAAKELAQAPRGPGQAAPSAPSANEAVPAPPAPAPPAPGVDDSPAPPDATDEPYAEQPPARDFPTWPQVEDVPYEEMEISRTLNDISFGVERAILARIDAEAYRQQKVVRYVEAPRGANLPVYDILVRTSPPGAAVYYLNELTFARYAREGSVDKVDRFWTAVASGPVQLAGKWRFVAVWPDGRRSAMKQFHITKEDAIELVPETRKP